MNKAQIKLELNQLLTIDNVVYQVAEHPALPGVPYIQRGARGFVIQLLAPDKQRFALKYFKLKYRVSELAAIGKALRRFSTFPGMRAADRVVFTMQSHPTLVRQFPPLEFGMLMPWIPGVTWFDVITKRTPLAPIDSLRLAHAATKVLTTLEENQLAHCDIAGANVMIDKNAGQVELVDIEEMYGVGLPRPVEFPAGQDGYQHQLSAKNGQWQSEGDRFGGAILLAELLGWQSARIRENSADEHYFSASEMQHPDSVRFQLLRDVLKTDYSVKLSDLFDSAWKSSTLADCPSFKPWQEALDELSPATRPTVSPSPAASSVISGRRMLSPSANVSSATASNGAAVMSASTRLCPNCGAANAIDTDFCKQCRYYLHGADRPARDVKNAPVQIATSGKKASASPISAVSPVAPVGTPHKLPSGAPPIVSARRMVSPGQSGQTLPAKLPEPPESMDGRWILIAVAIGFVLTAIIIALLMASNHP